MKRKSWKRTAAFVTSLAMTTTMLPSELSSLVTNVVHADEVVTVNFGGQSLKANDELPVAGITAGAEEKWTVKLLPGTINGTTSGTTNTEEVTITDVVKVTSTGIYKSAESEAQSEATFITAKDNLNEIEGLGIYVAAVEENAETHAKTLTLTWRDPVQTLCSIDFKDGQSDKYDSDVWNAVTAIINISKNGQEQDNHIDLSSGILDAKTGDIVTVKSTAALDFTLADGGAGDVIYKEGKVRNSETGDLIEYVYTITVGRKDITVSIRNTKAKYATASYVIGDSAPADLVAYKDSVAEANMLEATGSEYTINPDTKYVFTSASDNLSVFEESDNVAGFSAGDRKVDYVKTKVTPEGESAYYSYEFTAPYNDIYVSRSAPHKHEFTWKKSDDKKNLLATCSKNTDENSHTENFVYTYALGLDVNKEGRFEAVKPENITDGQYDTYKAEAAEALNEKYGFIKFRYATLDASTNKWSELTDDAPSATTYGKHKVVVDLYEDPFAYSPDDEEGDQQFVLEYNITPASGDSTDFPTGTVTIDFTDEAKGNMHDDKVAATKHEDNLTYKPYEHPAIKVTGLRAGDYTIEGDVTATTAGVKTLVVAGKGVYAGLYKELEWYCPGVNQYAVTSLSGTSYVYGSPLKFDVSGFEGNKDKITYKAVSAQDAEIYRLWTALNDTQKNAVRVAYGTSFVEPTEPQAIDLAADTVLDVLTENTLYTNIKAKDASVKTAIEGALGIIEYDVDALLGKYDVTAVYNGAPLAADKTTVAVTVKEVTLDLEQPEFTYDGTEKSFKLTATGIIPADSELLDALKNVEVKGLLKETNTDPVKVTAIKDAGNYRVVFNQEDVNSVLGDNYCVVGSANLTSVEATDGEHPTPATYQVDATINPLNLDGFATATTATNLFVENNKYQKPVIVVKDAEGNDLSETGYYLSGTISAKKAGTYTTRIVGMGNYTGTLKVNWTVLGAQDFADTIELSPITATPMKLTDGRKVVKVSFTRTPVANKTAGYEVVDYGYVYANGDYSNTTINNLVLDKVDTTTIKKNSSKNPSNSFNGTYETKIVDANDKGVAARGYVTIKHVETGATYTVYTVDALTAETYDHLTATQLTAGFKLAYGDPLAAIVKSNGVDKNVVKVKLTREMAEESAKNGMSVAEYGFIFTNSTAPTAAEALTKFERMNYEDVDGTVVKKSSKTVTDGSANNGTFVLPIVDKGNGVRYRAYVILKNADGATFTVYADQKIENYNTEDIWKGYNTVLAENDNVTAVSSIQTADFATLKETQANRLVTVNDVKLSAENVLIENTFGVNGEYYAAKFKTTRCLGQNISASDVTVLEYGFLYANECGAPTNENDYIVANAKSDTNKTSKIKKITKTPKADDVLTIAGTPYNLVVKYLDNDNKATYESANYHDIYARGYVTIKDNNTGIVSTVYGVLMKSEGFELT